MKNQAVTYLIIGLLIGIAGTAVITRKSDSKHVASTTSPMPASHNMGGMDMPGMDMSASTDTSMSMTTMTAELKGLTGDAFDKKFLSEMVMHHQGAVDMANMAATQAKHQEIKDLANSIISAQKGEITQMQQWQKQWNY